MTVKRCRYSGAAITFAGGTEAVAAVWGVVALAALRLRLAVFVFLDGFLVGFFDCVSAGVRASVNAFLIFVSLVSLFIFRPKISLT